MTPKNLEDLCKPIVPPEGVDDKTPVLARTHAEMVRSLRDLSLWFDLMARIVDEAPWADGLFDDLDHLAFDKLSAAQNALIAFKATRDCQGEA